MPLNITLQINNHETTKAKTKIKKKMTKVISSYNYTKQHISYMHLI